MVRANCVRLMHSTWLALNVVRQQVLVMSLKCALVPGTIKNNVVIFFKNNIFSFFKVLYVLQICTKIRHMFVDHSLAIVMFLNYVREVLQV